MTEERATAEGATAAAFEYRALVLLVDDQAIVAEAVRRALSQDPERALEVARSIRPTVILQDLVLPGHSGLDLVRQYRADPLIQSIPVIVLSGEEEAQTKSEAFTIGANDYVVKIPDPIELRARVRYHTRSYLNQIQRDEAYRALRESQRQLMDANLELERLNRQDGLTGLGNRRCLDEHLEKEWRRAAREQVELGVLMIDVDEFKLYNDSYGHLLGDRVLQRIAAVIRESIGRSSDLAARFGGEEFAVVLCNTNLDGARHVGEKIRCGVEVLDIPHRGGSSGRVTVSVGLSVTVPGRYDSQLGLLQSADLALYHAKGKGRNCLHDHPHEPVASPDRAEG